MAIRVGINGFGRIGRLVFRAGLNNPDVDFVAVNDLPVPTGTLAHLLKYDSTFGILDAKVESKEGALIVNGKELKVVSHKDPSEIPWKALGVDQPVFLPTRTKRVVTSKPERKKSLFRRLPRKKILLL